MTFNSNKFSSILWPHGSSVCPLPSVLKSLLWKWISIVSTLEFYISLKEGNNI